MAAAALLEEELQNSLATSEEDAEFEEDDELAAELMADNADAYAANIQLQNGMTDAMSDGEEEEDDDEMEDEQAILSDEDAEGEEDDEMADPASNNGEVEDDEEEEEEASDEDDEDEDEDGEGVGAVKIQPGLSEDDEDVASALGDEESAASIEDDDESKDSTDAEVEEQWQQAAEEEDDEEPTNPNRCMYVSCNTRNGATNVFPDSASRMKRMILVKSLNFIWPVGSAATMVFPSRLKKNNSHKADKAVAHRQCARSADALKADDGKISEVN
jgi:histone acetyltransferase SAS3